ncbi:hypothetical protein BH24ACT5_BH24ACT5_04780 [soil metagenome]
MNVPDIRAALLAQVKAALDDKWSVSKLPQPMETVNPPVAFVGWPEQIVYSQRLNGSATMVVPIELVVAEATDADAGDTLGLLVSTGVPGSLVDALNVRASDMPWRNLNIPNVGQMGARPIGPSQFTTATLFARIATH